MDFPILDDKNIELYAMTHYDNPSCSSIEEFQADFIIPTYLKRLFSKYKKDGDLRERLVINHIVTFINVFGPKVGVRILFFKTDIAFYSLLKTFLVFLNICPEIVKGAPVDIYTNEIAVDKEAVEKLRQITRDAYRNN